MIAWGQHDDGSDDVVVFTGIAEWLGGRLTLVRTPAASSFVVPAEWLERIKPVPSELADTVNGAEFYFNVRVGGLPDDAGGNEFERTGLEWPT